MTYQIFGAIESFRLTNVEVHASGYREPSQNDDYGVVGFNVVANWHPTEIRSEVPIVYNGRILTPREAKKVGIKLQVEDPKFQGIGEVDLLNVDPKPRKLFFIPQLTRDRLRELGGYGTQLYNDGDPDSDEERGSAEERAEYDSITALLNWKPHSGKTLRVLSLHPDDGDIHRTELDIGMERAGYNFRVRDYDDPSKHNPSFVELTGTLSQRSYQRFLGRLSTAEEIARKFHLPNHQFEGRKPDHYGNLLFLWYLASDGHNIGCKTAALPIRDRLNVRRELEKVLGQRLDN